METWKPVTGYEGFYEVSDHGNVRSLSRYVNTKWGTNKLHRGKVLKLIRQDTGYLTVWLSKLGHARLISVHVLVARAFIGPRPTPAHKVMHLDGTRDNNTPKNLRYGSTMCNAAFMVDDGTISRGVLRYNAKLTEKNVQYIRSMVKSGTPSIELARQFNVAKTTISAVTHGTNWAWVD